MLVHEYLISLHKKGKTFHVNKISFLKKNKVLKKYFVKNLSFEKVGVIIKLRLFILF